MQRIGLAGRRGKDLCDLSRASGFSDLAVRGLRIHIIHVVTYI